MAGNELQLQALKRLWRIERRTEVITDADLLAYAHGAGAVIIDGVEVVGVTYSDGGTQGVAMYPKEIVMTAALDILEEFDESDPLAGVVGRNVVHADFSSTRIES